MADRGKDLAQAPAEYRGLEDSRRRVGGMIARLSMAVLMAVLILPLYWGEPAPMAVVFGYAAFTLVLTLLLKGSSVWWSVASTGDVVMIGLASLYLGESSLVVVLLAPTVVGYAFVARSGLGLTALITSVVVLAVVLTAQHLGLVTPAETPDGVVWDVLVPLGLVTYALVGCYTQATVGLRAVEGRLLESWQGEQERIVQLQEQLEVSNRLEGLGRLAAGVAHDFNNQLTAILGFASVLDRSLGPEHPGHEDLQEISRAADRSRELTSQLLAFGRREIRLVRTTELNEVVARARHMLRRILREDIHLSLDLQEDAGLIRADPAQLERVVVNLVANSRDALPDGGAIEVATRLVVLDEAALDSREGLSPGRYAVLSVSDDGVGMDPETVSRIFEPFFTTKELGRGTGLGLATTYGIVRQNRGHIYVFSEPGEGTRVEVFLPSCDQEATAASESEDETLAEGIPWPARILVVEDDELVRRLAHRILSSEGYVVTTATGPRDALGQVDEGPPPELLLTDMVMPGMSGRALADELLTRFPDLSVLYMSGYTEDEALKQGVVDGDMEFLAKPFVREVLLGRVRAVLERRAGSG